MKTIKTYSKIEKKPGLSFIEKEFDTTLKSNEVLIKVLSASLCGTDCHIYNWDEWAQNRIKPPIVVGHEFAGRVEEIGESVSRVKKGDIVASETHVVCGKCEFCRKGQGHICVDTKIIGVDIDGAFSEYIIMPEDNLFVDSAGLDPKYLSILEPLGNAVHTVTHFDASLKTVAVIGCGPIGLMGVNILKILGAEKIIAIEPVLGRQELAFKMGADVVIDPIKEDVVKRMLEETNNAGVDVVCEFSGNRQALNQSLQYIKNGGAISLLGIFDERISVDFNEIVFKGLTLYGVTGRKMYENWDQIRSLLKHPDFKLKEIVTHEFDFAQIEKAFQIMNEKSCGKIVIRIGE